MKIPGIIRDWLPFGYEKSNEVKTLEQESTRADQAFSDLEKTIIDVTRALERKPDG